MNLILGIVVVIVIIILFLVSAYFFYASYQTTLESGEWSSADYLSKLGLAVAFLAAGTFTTIFVGPKLRTETS